MIKFTANQTLVMILSEENLTRMKQGDPILVDMEPMKGSRPIRYLQIGYSSDLKKTMEDLAPSIGPTTRVIG